MWLRHAAEAGYTDAAYELGALLVATGRREEAERWFLRAAEEGPPGTPLDASGAGQ